MFYTHYCIDSYTKSHQVGFIFTTLEKKIKLNNLLKFTQSRGNSASFEPRSIDPQSVLWVKVFSPSNYSQINMG